MIMAHMNYHPLSRTVGTCFLSADDTKEECAPTTIIYDNHSATSSTHSDIEDDGEDGNFVNHSVPFPWKLHEMLEIAEKESFTNVVSWLPDRQSFKVYQTDVFVRDIMPKYFRQTKYKSFQRQLNMWGFERLLSGPSKGGYLHQHFKRGQPALCRYMKRLKIKGTGNKKPVPSPFHSSSSNSKAITFNSLVPNQQHFRQMGGSRCESALNRTSSIISDIQTSASSTPFVNLSFKQETVPHSLSREDMARSCDDSVAHAPCNVDLFDEDTLASVLSSVLENPSNVENVPNDGDCVIFEGMQFFFVEDSRVPTAARRLSIELNGGGSGATRRRLSLVGAQRGFTTPIGNMGQHSFGEPVNAHHMSGLKERASRRFSLQRNGSTGANAYILKQIVEI